MENHRKSSYAIIPSYILDDENIEEGAKNLYARISMLSEEGRCWASNQYFADKHKVTTRCIQQWLKQLADSGYIEIDVDKGGFQTKRDIWITNDFKKQFTKRNTVRVDANHNSPPSEPQFASSIETNNNCTNKQQQPGSSSSSDLEKIKVMETLNLSGPTMQRALKFTIDEIKNAIECCLNAHKTIESMDAYFMSAITEKWQPRPNKEKIVKLNEENEKQQQQTRQRIYAEAKQLELAHKYNLKDNASFSVCENAITIKINGAFSPLEITDQSLKILRQYIKDNQKNT